MDGIDGQLVGRPSQWMRTTGLQEGPVFHLSVYCRSECFGSSLHLASEYFLVLLTHCVGLSVVAANILVLQARFILYAMTY